MNENVLKFLKIIVAIIIPNIGGWVGSRYVIRNLDWYGKLHQPPFKPPRWLFAPAWTILYSVIGFASYLVYEEFSKNGEGNNTNFSIALALFIVQLVYNWIWTFIFFEKHSLLWSLVDIIATLITAALCCFVFYSINQTAGLLFTPYIIWLCYASYLNVGVYILNKGRIIEATTVPRIR